MNDTYKRPVYIQKQWILTKWVKCLHFPCWSKNFLNIHTYMHHHHHAHSTGNQTKLCSFLSFLMLWADLYSHAKIMMGVDELHLGKDYNSSFFFLRYCIEKDCVISSWIIVCMVVEHMKKFTPAAHWESIIRCNAHSGTTESHYSRLLSSTFVTVIDDKIESLHNSIHINNNNITYDVMKACHYN